MHNRSLLSAVAGGVAMLCFAAAAFAGKQGSSLSLVVLSPNTPTLAASTTADASYGGQITFDVATTQSDRPFVNVRCHQGDTFVYDMWHGFFADYDSDPVYTLESHVWTGGAATCTARLVDWGKSGRERTLATTNFDVAG